MSTFWVCLIWFFLLSSFHSDFDESAIIDFYVRAYSYRCCHLRNVKCASGHVHWELMGGRYDLFAFIFILTDRFSIVFSSWFEIWASERERKAHFNEHMKLRSMRVYLHIYCSLSFKGNSVMGIFILPILICLCFIRCEFCDRTHRMCCHNHDNYFYFLL